MESWAFGSDDTVFVSQSAIQEFDQMYFPQILGNSVFSDENESSSKLTSSVVEVDYRESGLFDLKLEKNVDQENSHVFSSLSSFDVSVSSKATQIGVGSRSLLCKVHGCNKSLASCKDYHKRHKVCELHSKSTKAIVNGILQRFCQQCSRFHILSEFDNGKRSCRKRLADHNQRRRKPHVGRNGRLLPTCSITKDAGSKVKGSTMGTSSSMWQIKLEHEMASSITDVQLQSESRSSCDSGLQYPSFHGSSSVFGLFFNNDQTGGTDDFITMDPTPACSLLSSQSQDASSCHSSRNPVMFPLSHDDHQASGVSTNMNPLVSLECMNLENRVWSSDGSTINLLQLSSELERVDHQKDIFHNKCTEWCLC